MDIESAEVGFVKSIDMDYFCKYVKQFVIEVHSNEPADLLFKLEKCFLMFHRDQRFFCEGPTGPSGILTEWQKPGGYLLNLNRFKNETDLAAALFMMGELYFINGNFLKE
jgi:hypothetical protein